MLALFSKKPLTITLRGITNDSKDPSVDTFRSTTLQLLKRFGVPSEGLDLRIVSRGSAPLGGGEVILSIPIVHCLNVCVSFCGFVFIFNWVFLIFSKFLRFLLFFGWVGVYFQWGILSFSKFL